MCTDTDECSRDTDGCSQICDNTVGSYTCRCRPGYSLQSDRHSCRDVDECSSDNGGCEHTCRNSAGSYSCDCDIGFRLNSNDHSCDDIDECAANIHGCDHICTNIPGSFVCSCRPGYSLMSDGRLCQDINECEPGGFHACAQNCHNEVGSYTCSCHVGYRLGTDGRACDDIDECSEQSSGCEHTCFNSVGSYHCGCHVGWHLAWDQHTCLGNPCVDIGIPQNGERVCTGFVTNETCSFECHPGYYMTGSAERHCLPSAQWAGEQPQCPPKLCDRLQPPEKGYIRMPCRREYTSRCTMGCNAGYYQSDGNDANKDCVLQGSGVGWSDNPFNCSRITACEPNPCLHGGQCTPIDSVQYSCECTDTGYKGDRCQTGFITFPEKGYPILYRYEWSEAFEILANPTKELVLSLYGNGLEFEPSTIAFSYPDSAAKVRVMGRVPGLIPVECSISGESAAEFELPDVALLSVNNRNHPFGPRLPQRYAVGDDTLLPVGCNVLDLVNAPCENVSLLSTSPWYVDPVNVFHTFSTGFIHLQTNGITLPFSLTGTTIQTDTKITSLPLKEAFFTYIDNHSTDDGSGVCLDSQFPPALLKRLTETSAFFSSYVKSVNSLLPGWVRLGSSSEPQQWLMSSFSHLATVYSTDEASCGYLPFRSDSLVHVLRIPSNVTFNVLGELKTTTVVDGNICLVVNVCSKSFAITFPFSSGDGVIRVLSEKLGLSEWDFSLRGFGMSPSSSLYNPEFDVVFWDDQGASHQKSASGDIWLDSSFQFTVASENMIATANVHVDGSLFIQSTGMEKVFSHFLSKGLLATGKPHMSMALGLNYGETTMSFSFPTEETSLYISTEGSDNSIVKIQFNRVASQSPFADTALSTVFSINDNTNIMGYIKLARKSQPVSKTPMILNALQSLNETASRALHLSSTMVGRISPDQIIDLQKKLTTYKEITENCLRAASFANNTMEFIDSFTALQTEYWPLSRMLIETAGKFSHMGNGADTVYGLVSVFSHSHDKIMQIILNATLQAQLTEFGLTFHTKVCQRSLCFGNSDVEVVAKEERSWVLGGIISPTKSWSFDQYLTFPEGSKVVWTLADESISTKVTVDFHIFGEKKKLTLWTDNKIAHVQGAVFVDQFPVHLAGHCDTDTGSTLRWNITASFLHDADGLPRLLEDQLKLYLWDILDKSVTRYELAQKSVESLEQLFSDVNAELDNSNQRLESIEEQYVTALAELQDSEKTLKELEGEFESGSSDIEDHLNALDALCELRSCPIVQTPGVKCSPCTKLLSRKIPSECCTPCRNTRTVIEQYECQTTCFDWSETCTVAHYCRCSLWGLGGCSYGEIWKCTAKTNIYACSKTCDKAVPYYDENECCETCYDMETGYVQAECCEEIPDLSVTQEPTCLSENDVCRSVRNTIFSRYEQSWGDVAAKLAQLQSARSRRNTNQINLESLRVQLDAQRLYAKEREALSERYRLSLHEAKLTLESVKNTLSDSFKLRSLFDGTVITGLQIVNVSLAMMLTSNNSRIIPLKVVVQHDSLLQEVGIVLDLDSIDTSLTVGVKKIGRTIFGNIDAALHALSMFPGNEARRRKRSTTEETTGSCHVFHEISTYVTEIFTLIQDFESEQLRMKRLFRESEQHLLALKQNLISNKGPPESAYNKTILVDYFNITDDPIKGVENISEEAHATLNLIETISLLNRNNEDSSTGTVAENRLYVSYEEITHNASYFDVCFGFRDCILQVIEDYYNLLYPTQETEVIALEGTILEVKDSLVLLLNETSLNRSGIYRNLQSLMACINTTRAEHWLCGTAPSIQQQPPLTNEVLKGHDLMLECNATGVPAPKYEWIKDSKTKVGNSAMLMLKRVKEDAEGEYVCIASNRFGSSSSLPIQVIVTSKPQITQHPVSQELALGSEVGTTMNCSATGTPTPFTRWFFRRDTSSDWVQLNNGTASDYILILHPAWQDEGWYACKAENKHGETMSEAAFLMILDITVAVPTVNITFKLKHKESIDMRLPRVKREDLSFSTQIPSIVAQSGSTASMPTVPPEENITSTPDVNTGHGMDFDSIVSVLEDITGLGSVSELFLIQDVANKGYTRLQVTLTGKNLTNGTDYPRVYPHYAKQMTNELNEFQSKISELEQTTNARNLSAVYGGQNVTFDPNVFEVVDTEFLCPPGQGLDENGYICVNCPPGRYRPLADLFWASECRLCPKGFYQEQQGRDNCDPCPDGTTTYSSGTRDSTMCYEPCPPGSFSENGLKSQNCTPCPEDTYQEHWEQTSCTACPPGRGTRHQGATSPQTCEIKCKEGHFSETGFEPCTTCPKGSFQNSTGQLDCVDCGVSLTTSSGGSISSEQCREHCHAGFYFFASSTSVAGECSPCPKGYYLPQIRNPREEMRKCLKCPFGLTTASVGATSSSDCGMSCRPGTYSDTGLHPCTTCSNGTYQPEEGMKGCMLCLNGTEATTEGSTQCTEIPSSTLQHQDRAVQRVITIILLSCGIGIGVLATLVLVVTKKIYLVRRASR
ncbi:uncharacterized protein LOC144881494 [Branchiostoma floridae x Branchiostoma japonicum]